MKRFLEAGRIVNTHGIKGEVKIQPWADEPAFLCRFKQFYIDGKPVDVKSARVQKDCVLASLSGVSSIEAAELLRNRVVCIDREEVTLPDGEYFIQDIVGLTAINCDTGAVIGKVKEVMNLPGNDVYVIDCEPELLIPAVPEFINNTDIEGGTISVKVLEVIE